MFNERQLKQYRDSLIEEHRCLHRDEPYYDTTIQEAILIGQVSCLTHALQDGGYDPIKKRIRRLIEIDPIDNVK